jgi:hypothetical protein
MQSALLGAVSAARTPALHQYVLQNLGKGVPPNSTVAPLIQNTRLALFGELAGRNIPGAARVNLNRQQQLGVIKQFMVEVKRDKVERQKLAEKLVGEMAQETPAELRARLTDQEPMVRWVAVQVIAQRWLRLEPELINLLNDPSIEVREAAHLTLVRLSRGADFGPAVQATAAQRAQAAAAWRRWLALQDPPPGAEVAAQAGGQQ